MWWLDLMMVIMLMTGRWFGVSGTRVDEMEVVKAHFIRHMNHRMMTEKDPIHKESLHPPSPTKLLSRYTLAVTVACVQLLSGP